jgi:histidine triad (HIT) family protein
MQLPMREPCPLCETARRYAWTYEGREEHNAIIVEDDLALAFIRDDRRNGYSYVIPKRHVPLITDLTDQEAGAVMTMITGVARALVAEVTPDGLNVFQCNGVVANQSVPHVHFHLAPRWESEMTTWEPSVDRWSGDIQPLALRVDLARRLAKRLAAGREGH